MTSIVAERTHVVSIAPQMRAAPARNSEADETVTQAETDRRHPDEEPPEPTALNSRAMLRRIARQAAGPAPDTVTDAPLLIGWQGTRR